MSRSKKSSSRRNKTTITILLILLVIITVWTAYKALQYLYVPELTETIEAMHPLFVTVVTDKNLTMDEVLGFGDELKAIIMPPNSVYFFKLSPGLNFSREIQVVNPFGNNLKLDISVGGNISRFLTYSMENEVLKPGTAQIINLTVQIPLKNITAGKYKGNFTIKFIPEKE